MKEKEKEKQKEDKMDKMLAIRDRDRVLRARSGHGGLLEVRLGNMDFTPTSIFRAFGRCEDHDVLSFRSLYGAFHRSRGWLVFDPKRQGLVPGMQWLSRQAVPALLSPTDALRDVVRGISAQQHGGDGGERLGVRLTHESCKTRNACVSLR